MAKLSSNVAPNLFWRTFVLIMFFIIFTVMGWLQSFRVLNEAPYVRSAAQQIVSVANLTRYALITADPFYRTDLLLILAQREGVRILPKEQTDEVLPLAATYNYTSSIADVELLVRRELGNDTVMAGQVNGDPGLWVSINIDGDSYWLMTSSTLINPPYGNTWIWWALAALVASILGATFITRRLTQPLKLLSNSARAFGRGEVPPLLPENSGPEELRELNSSFNRMVQDITHFSQDRELLLAGVSHDLRTPITRLRLEAEMADISEDTRKAVVSDLEQMEAIVNQFLDYARRNDQPLQPVNLSQSVSMSLTSARIENDSSIRLHTDIEPDVFVQAHPTELSRVIQNLCTNASRYGRSEDGLLYLSLVVRKERNCAVLSVSDQGQGLDMSQAERIMRPFERGDSARAGVTGSGLGLAIVDRIVRRSGGQTELQSVIPHGLKVIVRMPCVNCSNKPSA